MATNRTTITVTGAAGGAGVATANATSSRTIRGCINAIYLQYTDSPPSTTDVTIAEAINSPAAAILTLTDANTDGWFFPMAQVVNKTGTAITGQGAEIYVDDYVKVTIAQANNADGVVCTIVWDD